MIKISTSIFVFIMLLFVSNNKNKIESVIQNKIETPKMIWIKGGTFSMGSDKQSNTNDALPYQFVKVDGYWMDETEVTNAQFEKFCNETGYVTVAERKINWEELKKILPPGTPKPSEEDLEPGSLIYSPPTNPVPLDSNTRWWKWCKGANWKHPFGPDSSIKGKENYPVVQIAFEDAQAYAKWAKKRLPTEAEWEFAARGGMQQKQYAWGDELNPDGVFFANYFQGDFPYNNTQSDGFLLSAPVKSFPKNNYGLYDMIGNVWELCADFYEVPKFCQSCCHSAPISKNPSGPMKTFDPFDPNAIKHVIKGGSYLCSIEYCSNFKPSGRQGISYDSGMSHIGFRCVKSKK